jgi:hypothetical protein
LRYFTPRTFTRFLTKRQGFYVQKGTSNNDDFVVGSSAAVA